MYWLKCEQIHRSKEAGDAGRGFAVVAEEINQLASNSAEATKKSDQSQEKITSLIERIVSEAESLTAIVTKVTERTENLTTSSQDITSSMKNISEATESIRQQLKSLN